jgi:hypothetical protein
MRRSKLLIAITFLLASSTVFIACKNDGKQTKASSTGSPSEIIVVSEDNLWKSSVGDTIRSFFGDSRPGLPQPEPYYKLAQIKLSEFERLFQTHRNILAISIDSSLTEAKVEMAKDFWAAPQRVANIKAPTLTMLKEAFNKNKREILNMYENAEIERLQKLYSGTSNIKAIEALRDKFGITMNIPGDYYIAVNKENFMWLRREANTLSQGILVYTYPYTDTSAFKPARIKSVRNQYTQLYVPGPSDSSYMIVADQDIAPVTRTLSLKNNLAIEMRGLWEVEKDFMGGPFVSYTFVDKRNNLVITLDGYVYAPNANKAELMKQVQSILLSFEYFEKK